MNIYVSNLGSDIQDDDLKKLFTAFGEVSSSKIINDRETGRSRGFGFVEMPDDNSAKNAIEQLNGASVKGKTVSVVEARPKDDSTRSANRSGFSKNNKW